MANLKPSDLPQVTSLQDEDIFIVETEPNNIFNLSVNKIEKKDLFSGYIKGIDNVGIGVPIGSGISTDGSLALRSIINGAGIDISQVGDQIVVAYTGSEESTTASNIGSGSGLVSGISDFDIKIRSLLGGSGIELLDSGDTFIINFTGQTEATTVSNIGSGVPLVSGIDDVDVKVRSIDGGSGINVLNEGNTLMINFTGQTEATTVSNIGSGVPLVSGIDDVDVKVRSIDGGSGINVLNEGNTLMINFTGESGGGGGGSSFTGTVTPFSFFSNAENNVGVIEKTYYDTPTSNTYLSGIDVDSASNMSLYLRWDGPNDSYMGSAFINGQQIPEENIIELGTYTRRFEGFISGIDCVGQENITGIANGFTGTISLSEAGAGPTPLSVIIADISTATPKAGENLGSTDLKGGDEINVYATFDTSDVTGIKVYDSGISDGIGYSFYSLTDTGDGNYTATIPIEINSSRVGLQGINLVANNNFGTAGNDASSINQVSLDQTYPSISASDPSSYNGRSDGLREGESTSFSNTISNWTDGVDYILYETLSNEISITGSGNYENPKFVSYVQGIFNSSENLRIDVSRTANGATDSSDVTIKIANGPIITGIDLSSTASSATPPDIVGSSEIKGGDIVNAEVYINGNGVSANNIDIYVLADGVSNGMQQNWSSYSHSTLADGSFKYTVPVQVTSSSSRDGDQTVSMRPKNNFGSIGDDFTSTDTAVVNNGDYPSVSISSISYPGSQDALKGSESATVSNNASLFDSVLYSSPNGDLAISNDTIFDASKNVSRQGGGYNISSSNFTISATKNSNGMVRSASSVVNIANSNMSLSIASLASELSSSPAGVSDNFQLNSNQRFLEIPSLETNPSQTSASELVYTSSGTNPNSNDFRITVRDSDTKGDFPWVVSGLNLAGKLTSSISSNPNYKLVGFSSRTVASNPSTALGRGLFPIGTTVSNPNNVTFENIAEGGGGPNGGTIYNYKNFADGTQLIDSMDYNNEFTICDSSGLTTSSGDYCYNLDKTIRDANTSTAVPATANIKED